MKKLLCSLFGHDWYYFENAGMGDFLKRTCARCHRKETYYGRRSYYHDKESTEWMTDEERKLFLEKWNKLKDI